MKKVESIEITLSEPRTRDEVAECLRLIASDIENGYTSGIVGFSADSWGLTYSEEDEEEYDESEE